MLPQRKFVKGVDASTPIYNQPPGSVPRMTNHVLTKRGGFKVVDGNTTWSLLLGAVSAGTPPWEDIFLPQIWDIPAFYVGLKFTGTYVSLIFIPPTSYDLTTNKIADLTAMAPSSPFAPAIRPKMLQFNNQLLIFGDPESSPYYWNGVSSFTIGGINPWPANTGINLGEFVTDGTNMEQAIEVTGDQLTGGSAPSWGTNLGDLTSDNHVTWINRGPALPTQINNTFKLVFPQWLRNTPISSQTIIQVAFLSTTRCGYWQANTTSLNGNTIIDSNNNVQVQTAEGGDSKTGQGEPYWNTTVGGTTIDNNVTWTNNGPATFYNFKALQSGTTADTPQPPQFTTTVGSLITDNNIVWRNEGLTSNAAIPPRGAKFAIVYAGSLWVANTSPFTTSDNYDGPTALRMSDLNNANSWNPLNAAFLGKDDGTAISGLATFTIAESGIAPTGTLVVFKNYATYQIIGVFGASDFTITQAQTDMGCIAPDTIQFLPGFGIARMSHLGPAVFDGVRDRLFGEQIRPYLFGGEPDITPIYDGEQDDMQFMYGSQTNNPPMYIMAGHVPPPGDTDARALNRLFCFDLVLKAWVVIDLPFGVSCIRQIREQSTGIAVTTIAGGSHDGAVRSLFDGDDWHDVVIAGDTVPVSSSVQSPEVFSKSAAEKLYCRAIYIRGTGMANGLTLDIEFDTGTAYNGPAKFFVNKSGEFEAFIPIHALGKSMHVIINASGSGEIHTIDWDADAQPAAPATLI